MSDQTNWDSSHNAISSQGSEDGLSHFDGPDGRRMSPCGQDRRLASLTAQQAEEKGLMTKETYGPTGDGLWISADLQSCLESRLQAKLADSGSPIYKLTWKQWDMGQQRQICALRASARRISASDYGLSESTMAGWVTASARDWKDTAGMGASAVNPDGSIRGRFDQMPRQAQLASWPISTHTQTQPTRLTSDGRVLTGSDAGMGGSGQLKPEHSRWAMGYPPAWDVCGVTAMQSFHKWRKSSSNPQLKQLDLESELLLGPTGAMGDD